MLKYCSILFMVSFSAPVVEQHTDYRSLQVLYGEKASLVCDFKNITNVGKIQWQERFKNNTNWDTLYDNNQINPLFNNSVLSKNESQSSIMIVNVPSDNKEHRCIIGHGKEKPKTLIIVFKLTFIEPNISIKISNFTNGSQITVIENKAKTLSCSFVGGTLGGNLSWTRSNCNGTFGTSSSTWSNITILPNREDNGLIYTCSLFHLALNMSLKTHITLNVLYNPTVNVSMVQLDDATIELICIVDSNPPNQTLTWTKDGISISSDSELNITQNGYYTCTANNSIGIGNNSIEVRFLSNSDETSTTRHPTTTTTTTAAGNPRRHDDVGQMGLLLYIGICFLVTILIAICTLFYTRLKSVHRRERKLRNIEGETTAFQMTSFTQIEENPITDLEFRHYAEIEENPITDLELRHYADIEESPITEVETSHYTEVEI